MPLHKMVGLKSAEVWANGSVLVACLALCVYVQVLLYMYLFGYTSEGNVILKKSFRKWVKDDDIHTTLLTTAVGSYQTISGAHIEL